MRGMPKWFNTKADVVNALAFNKEKTLEKLRLMYAERFVQVNTGVEYNEGDILKEGQYVMEIKDINATDPEQAELKKYIFEKQENPNARIFQLLSKEELGELGIA